MYVSETKVSWHYSMFLPALNDVSSTLKAIFESKMYSL